MFRQAIALFLALTLVSTSGCSFMFMNRAPEPVVAPNYPVECTSSNTAPVLDTICAGYFALNTAVIASAKSCSKASGDEYCVEESERGGGVALSLGLGAVCLAGAISGYGKAERCRAVKNQNALCITGNVQACGALNPTWRPSQPQPAGWPAPAPAAWPAPAPAAAPATAPAAPPAAPPAPEQRTDGLPHGATCTATWQCAVGLTCNVGRCTAP